MISGNCVELLRACHILPMFPEVTALQNAIRKKSLPLILKAEQAGYSSDNCAYVKADIGLFLDGGMGPGKPIPFPTITVCNYVGCNVYVKWFEHLADVTRIEALHAGRPVRPHRPSRARPTCSTWSPSSGSSSRSARACPGRKFDIDELREILAHAARAEEGYARAKDLCKHHPAPFDAYFDAINMMGPINVLRGTREAAEFFDVAVAEFEGLVAQGLGPLSEERFRTVVEGPPPYPFYKNFRNLFAKWGAVAVAVHLLDGRRHLGVRVPARSAATARVHRRADAAREPDQPLDRRALRADQALRRGVGGGRAGHPLDQVLPALLGRAGGHARLLHPRRSACRP